MMGRSGVPRRFTLTYAIIALNVLVYVYTSILSGNALVTSDNVLVQYGQANWLVIENGWYWQLFTSMFVHVNIEHIVGNMLFLLIFGLRAEEMFDAKEYLIVYLLSGLAGNLLTLLFGLDMLSAGASGCIFGMFGATIIYIRRAVGQSIIGALAFAFLLLIFSMGVGVNVLAHLGGLVIGLLIGYLLAAKRKEQAPYRYSYTYTP
jgi:rhomboid protease GluP